MISKSFLKNWVAVFITLLVMDVVWHKLIFGWFYNQYFTGVARYVGGEFLPLVEFIVIADILVAYGFAYIVKGLSQANGKWLVNGLLFGLIVNGAYTIYGYAIIPGWQPAMVVLDIITGAVFGAVLGMLLKKLSGAKKK